MKIDEIQQSIIERFSSYTDYMEKYQELMNIAIRAPKIDSAYKTRDNLVNGCQNNVWLTYEVVGDKMVYHYESDAMIVKGIITLIMEVVSGQKAEDIVNADLHFINDIGLKDQMSYTRGNGLRIIVEKILEFAKAEMNKGV